LGEVVNTELQIHRLEFVNTNGTVSVRPRAINREAVRVARS
jgi:hypothetical protein